MHRQRDMSLRHMMISAEKQFENRHVFSTEMGGPHGKKGEKMAAVSSSPHYSGDLTIATAAETEVLSLRALLQHAIRVQSQSPRP